MEKIGYFDCNVNQKSISNAFTKGPFINHVIFFKCKIHSGLHGLWMLPEQISNIY